MMPSIASMATGGDKPFSKGSNSGRSLRRLFRFRAQENVFPVLNQHPGFRFVFRGQKIDAYSADQRHQQSRNQDAPFAAPERMAQMCHIEFALGGWRRVHSGATLLPAYAHH
jgi:hypothetical protein